ncbi:hydrogenase formation protein HypD [Aliarcobacter butzleri]|uniref:Hydrogenase formation protein HypD n=1 Tax=Aliarcobacter butzleri L352 TaxID=1447260 RepID=A0A837JEU3_9BACT|nr:hydrogenase formation protein HypD [Aliarcobacter butzleri]KLE06282.1 hydrogenase formation protein HypD [Aliarcobacter butzleri L352]MCT7561657.1 hydrogenase formation protein HypD [Aliarcobacter butzleri]MDN5042418.1 hydrogenase formation protein HypD [Aliarcobacter butzleri]MDN5042485.1 hydrogenase formation protein HypD [Aliarcobacter butzleri]MDN5099770.1 hydrogenase formation protein HypD [Aliarcobacter butzleri]
MEKELQLKDLYDGFRDSKVIKAYKKLIDEDLKDYDKTINIMEVCGGHTHTIMKYGIPQLLNKKINFIHGPGCPVCVMPKDRIDSAYELSLQKDVILVTLGDMIKVPGSKGSLQKARSEGADVRFVYSPMDCLKIADENKDKTVVFFAIGFETTTPMTCALMEQVIKQDIKNILFHINHITVPEVMQVLVQDENCKIDAFLGPSHVSVISGSKIYEEFPRDYNKPVVVSGFEPVDVMQSISMIVKQFKEKRANLEIEYKRLVSYEGNLKAQELINKYFKKVPFKFRGIGEVENSGYELKDEFDKYNAKIVYKDILPTHEVKENKACKCPEILKGVAKPTDCKIFGTVCTPTNPIGSCMVSSEGACSAYYKYGNLL